MDARVNPLGEVATIPEGSTPDLILRDAGRLFAMKGFHGTSTREIANAVGIRQPSLFHHFASKAVIAQRLLEYDRLRSPLLQGLTGCPSASPSVRLYQMFRAEIVVEMTSRYELRGLYLSDILDEPNFAFWKTVFGRAVARVCALVVEGIEAGELASADPDIVARFFDAVVMGVVRWNDRQTGEIDPDTVLALLMRAILSKPDDLAAIRDEAQKLALEGAYPSGPMESRAVDTV